MEKPILNVTDEDVDKILKQKYSTSDKQLAVGYDDMFFNYAFQNSNEAVELLLKYKLFVVTKLNGLTYYAVTELGEEVVNSGGGFGEFRKEIDAKTERARLKEELEIINLKQAVRKNSWEFIIMIGGSIGGIVSFIILIYQFITKK